MSISSVFFGNIISQFESLKPKIAEDVAIAARDYFVYDVFDKQKTPQGVGWDPLTDYTMQHRVYPDYPILYQEGKLRDALVESIETGSVTFDHIILLVDCDYAWQQNYGDGARLPAREFMGTSLELEDRVIESVNKNIIELRNNT